MLILNGVLAMIPPLLRSALLSAALAISASTAVAMVDLGDRFSDVDLSAHEGRSVEVNLLRLWTGDRNTRAAHVDPIAAGLKGGGLSMFRRAIGSGELRWDEPMYLSFGEDDDGLIEVALNEATFNWGLFGQSRGQGYGADVTATVTLLNAPTPVPLPASGVLLLGALAGMAVVARRRRRTA